MAWTNNLGQTRVGVRVPLSVVIPTQSALLDSYSGAAAAFSLRKLTSTYTGSAIRVRRSSDNAEQNIGFDSNGNLDTVALSSFVGSGSGFVTTWYDQSGNNFNRAQTTASGQPNIVYLGAINMVNGKPAMYFDGTNTEFAVQGPRIGETYMGAGYSSTILNVTKLDSSYSTTAEYALFGGFGWYDSRFSIYNNKWYLINTGTGISSTDNVTLNQIVSSVVFAYATDRVRINGVEVINGNVGTNGGSNAYYLGRSYLGGRYKGYFQEHIIYGSDKTSDISSMESNINSYYSSYPNSTTVWNLLKAVYSADTTASSSLKTSLVAAYNGESNANDSFGTNNGTAQGGLTYTTGKIGDAFNFNGTNAYVSLPNTSGEFNFTGDFSVSMWVNFSNVASSVDSLFSNLIGGSTYGYGYTILRQSNNWYFQINAGNGTTVSRMGMTFNNNTWYHFTLTKKSSNEVKMYVNGIQGSVSTQSAGTVPSPMTLLNPTYQSNQSCNIAAHNSSVFMNGKIDALNVWTKELTSTEVTELYNSGNGAQYIGDNFYKPTTNDALGINNGTAQGGLTYGVGKVGTAFQFNGTTAYVSLPNNSFNFTGDFSVSGWINQSSTPLYHMIMGNQNSTGGSSGYSGWIVWVFNNKLTFDVYDNTTGAASGRWQTTSTLATNTWIHFTVTKKPNQAAKIYLNGSINGGLISGSNTANVSYLPTTYSVIGVNKYSSIDGYWNGKIDGLSVWQKELTQSEITEIYNSGNGKQYPN